MARQFNQKEADHEIVLKKLSHSFALKMAIIICFSVMASILGGGLLTIEKITQPVLISLVIIALFFGAISFRCTRSACLL